MAAGRKGGTEYVGKPREIRDAAAAAAREPGRRQSRPIVRRGDGVSITSGVARHCKLPDHNGQWE
jgi:uncharacterized protein (UPF0147 family)